MHGAVPPLPLTSSWRDAWLSTGTSAGLGVLKCDQSTDKSTRGLRAKVCMKAVVGIRKVTVVIFIEV
jgi:hypothetical protein